MDVKLTILVPEELRRRAKAAAALRDVTISEIVREALTRLVEEVESAEKEVQRPAIRGEPDAATG